jgi:hypothetical protein
MLCRAAPTAKGEVNPIVNMPRVQNLADEIVISH